MDESAEVRTKLVPYRDAAGRRQWAEMSAEGARELDTFDRWMRRREALYRRHHRHGSDRTPQPRRRAPKHRYALVGYLNFELETMVRELIKRPDGSPWVGPRRSFSLHLGESAVWGGPGRQSLWLREETREVDGEEEAFVAVYERAVPGGVEVCRFCYHLKTLSPSACCLGCARTGEGKED